MDTKERICTWLEENKQEFIEVSDKIWATPELCFREKASAQVLIEALKANGFTVETGLAEMETAFKGTFGSGKPVLGFLGEFDALAALSQQAACAEHKPVVEGGNGHGCGHNALGAGTLAAVVALKKVMQEENLPGTIIFYGCPAEEAGCGKSFMARDGIFNEIDAALAWHPGTESGIMGISCLANLQVEFSFKGASAHAAAAPHMGRSALDAAELMNIGVQFLREHVVQEARLHYAFLDVGGTSPNVVQNSARLFYYIRAPKAAQVRDIYKRVQNIAAGAALMTDTTMETHIKYGMADLVTNETLGKLCEAAWQKIGPHTFSPEAEALAKQMETAVEVPKGKAALSAAVPTYKKVDMAMPGSTDVGDVSYIVPTVTINTTCAIAGTAPHSWQFTAQSGSVITHEGLIYAAKVLALTAADILKNPAVLDEAKAELQSVTGGEYDCLIPAGIKPVV